MAGAAGGISAGCECENRRARNANKLSFHRLTSLAPYTSFPVPTLRFHPACAILGVERSFERVAGERDVERARDVLRRVDLANGYRPHLGARIEEALEVGHRRIHGDLKRPGL